MIIYNVPQIKGINHALECKFQNLNFSYDPVCSRNKEYGNACEACSNPNVKGYRQGKCDKNRRDDCVIDPPISPPTTNNKLK